MERVAMTPLGIRVVQLITADPDAARCPECRQLSPSGKEWTLTGRGTCRSVGRRCCCSGASGADGRCRTETCARASFTEQVPELPARVRTTTRLCVRGWRRRSKAGVARPRWLRRSGCRGRRCITPWSRTDRPRSANPRPLLSWGWMRPGSAGPDGSAGQAAGCARIRGRPGSSARRRAGSVGAGRRP
jgi:hypothetical protein